MRGHLSRPVKCEFVQVRRVLGCMEEELRNAYALIRTLDPRLGLRFS